MSVRIELALACLLLVLLVAIGQGRATSEHEYERNDNRRRFLRSESEIEDQDEGLTSQLAESLAMAVELAPKNSNGFGVNLACEPIQFEFCTSMQYKYTRMPNFFQDPNQIAAAQHAQQYERLARTGCSGHLLNYLCELLAPVCLDNNAGSKYEVFPCRPFCRRVRQDCLDAIMAIWPGGRVPKAFNCEDLPYESNGGGDATGAQLKGPCHEITVNQSASSPASNHLNNQQAYKGKSGNNKDVYQPYDPEFEFNAPPFGTGSSRLDANMFKVPPMINQQQQQQQQRELERRNNTGTVQLETSQPVQSGVMSHAQALGQQLALVLVKYSNLLSVLTLICLLLVVNAKRLKRLGNYMNGGRKSSSSSSSSSNGSQRRLAKGSSALAGGGGGGPAHRPLGSVSPSSSSRSLMLIAAADGKHARPNHKLVSEQLMASLEPSQKLIHQAGHDRRTLINVNGTLERQKEQTSATARYHLMQSALNNRDHQYDYIQHTACGTSQLERQQPAYWSSKRQHNLDQDRDQDGRQVYSNILLSSPSHQVLLFSDQAQQVAGGAAREPLVAAAAAPMRMNKSEQEQQHQQPWMSQPGWMRSHLTTAASLSSPYAAPEIMSGGSINRRQTLQQLAEHQRSFQRRPSGRTAASRHWVGPSDGHSVPYVTSGASTSSSASSGGSSSVAFSAGEPGGQSNLLLGGPSSLPSPPPVPRTVVGNNSQR